MWEIDKYNQEIEDIFEQTKEGINYDSFTVSVRKQYDKELVKCMTLAKDIIESYVRKELPAEEKLKFLTIVQEQTLKFVEQAKMQDMVHRSVIYQLNPNSELDSMLDVGTDLNNIDMV